MARVVDILPYLRSGPNVLGVASYFNIGAVKGDLPRIQAGVSIVDEGGAELSFGTDVKWSAWPADGYFNPSGNAGISWYAFPNEMLDRSRYPLGWANAGFAGRWPAAVLQPAWQFPTYTEPGPAPVTLIRSACSVKVISATRQILDYGQEFMGGVNLSECSDVVVRGVGLECVSWAGYHRRVCMRLSHARHDSRVPSRLSQNLREHVRNCCEATSAAHMVSVITART